MGENGDRSSKNFTLYGTGRKPYIKEMKEISKQMSILKKNGFPMKDVLKAVITSKSFLGIK